jgi:hypothetical protein
MIRSRAAYAALRDSECLQSAGKNMLIFVTVYLSPFTEDCGWKAKILSRSSAPGNRGESIASLKKLPRDGAQDTAAFAFALRLLSRDIWREKGKAD